MNNVRISSFIYWSYFTWPDACYIWWSSYTITVMEQYYISLYQRYVRISLISTDVINIRSLSTTIVPAWAYIYFNIPGCYYFSSIFAHRPEVHRSAESSAVGLVLLYCTASNARRSSTTLQVFNDSRRFHRLKLVKHCPSSTYIPDLRSSFCCMAICALHCAVIASSFALHRCNARRSSTTTSRNISTFVRLHSCLLVICLLWHNFSGILFA